MFTFIFGVFSRSISTKQHTFFSLSAPKDTEKMTHSMLVSGGVGCVSVIVESKENFFCPMLDATYQIMNTQYFAQFNLNINLQACASFSLLLILLGGSLVWLMLLCCDVTPCLQIWQPVDNGQSAATFTPRQRELQRCFEMMIRDDDGDQRWPHG